MDRSEENLSCCSSVQELKGRIFCRLGPGLFLPARSCCQPDMEPGRNLEFYRAAERLVVGMGDVDIQQQGLTGARARLLHGSFRTFSHAVLLSSCASLMPFCRSSCFGAHARGD